MLTASLLQRITESALEQLRLDWFPVGHLPDMLQEDVQPYTDPGELARDAISVVEHLLTTNNLVLGSLGANGITPWPEQHVGSAMRRLASLLRFGPHESGGFTLVGHLDAWIAEPSKLLDWRFAQDQECS